MNENWTTDDPRMWREQCRISDVAFQSLFATSKGKPLPDWAKEGLPKLTNLIELARTVEIYLKMPSLDGNPKRQALRAKLKELL